MAFEFQFAVEISIRFNLQACRRGGPVAFFWLCYTLSSPWLVGEHAHCPHLFLNLVQ
jgi:hypothetical protein